MMSFLYFCCIEALLTCLLRTNKTAIFIASLLINCLLSVFTSHPLLQDLLLIESLCFLFYYYSDRLLSEIVFYLSFLTVIKNLVILIPISPIASIFLLSLHSLLFKNFTLSIIRISIGDYLWLYP